MCKDIENIDIEVSVILLRINVIDELWYLIVSNKRNFYLNSISIIEFR